MIKYEWQRTLCEREGKDDEAVRVYDHVDDAMVDAVCSRAFRGRLSLDYITEGDIFEA